LESTNIDRELEYSATTLLNTVNHGGLAKPTDYTFLLALICWKVSEEMK